MHSKTITSNTFNGVISTLTISEEPVFQSVPFAYKDDTGKAISSTCYVATFDIPKGVAFSLGKRSFNHLTAMIFIVNKAEDLEVASVSFIHGSNQIDSIPAYQVNFSAFPDDIVIECRNLIIKGKQEDHGGYLYDVLLDALEGEE